MRPRFFPIQSEGLSEQLAEHFDTLMAPENAWRVYLNEKNKLRWESSSGIVSTQPARSFGQRRITGTSVTK
jgi:hypothetical protein